jgi:ABC-type oligopeptide transport system ATPase subunit
MIFMNTFFLSNTPLFHGISESEISELLSCLGAKERKYKKDEIIIRAGSSVSEIGLVESGSVDDVFFHPKEDYTRRLLDAIPNRRTSLRKRIKIAPTAQWPTGSDKKAAPPAEKEE